MRRGDWFAEVKAHGVVAVGRALGLRLIRGRSLSPCPGCGAEQRGYSTPDQRGPIGTTPDNGGWACHRCDLRGDAVNLAALIVVQTVKPDGRQWADIHRTCAQVGLCSPMDAERDPSIARLARKNLNISPSENKPEGHFRPSPKRPPSAEVEEQWVRCGGVTEDSEAAAWLRSRSLDPSLVESRNLARALPVRGHCPKWARLKGRPWSQTGHRLVLPLYGAGGMLESLRARRVITSNDKLPKGAAPTGAQVQGLVLADGLARLLLQSGTKPEWWPSGQRLRVIVAEGDPDFLTWATFYGDAAETAPAVIGIVAGSWTSDLAARIPSGVQVVIRTHNDAAGDKYARQIIKSLSNRCDLLRGGKGGLK